jgi:hypothetical protein
VHEANVTTHTSIMRRCAALGAALSGVVLAVTGVPADAAIVATVPLATSASYAVLAGSTVTNTGGSVLNGSLGLAPGTSITGFPPGQVVPPGTTDNANAAAQQAQSDLTAAYINAAGRPIDGTTTADLGNLILQGGVYAGPSKGALSLTGPLTLDGAGNASSVFIFQTNSTLTTASGSTVNLINGAQECNVFWQVGSSATLGTGSTLVGNVLALTSITVTNGVTVRGRALARNGAVTLDTDTFTSPTCNTTQQVTTTSTSTTSTSTTTTRPSTTTSSPSATTTAVTPTTPVAIASPDATAPTGFGPAAPTSTTVVAGGSQLPPTVPPDGSSTDLPRTGVSMGLLVLVALALITIGGAALRVERARAPSTP